MNKQLFLTLLVLAGNDAFALTPRPDGSNVAFKQARKNTLSDRLKKHRIKIVAVTAAGILIVVGGVLFFFKPWKKKKTLEPAVAPGANPGANPGSPSSANSAAAKPTGPAGPLAPNLGQGNSSSGQTGNGPGLIHAAPLAQLRRHPAQPNIVDSASLSESDADERNIQGILRLQEAAMAELASELQAGRDRTKLLESAFAGMTVAQRIDCVTTLDGLEQLKSELGDAVAKEHADTIEKQRIKLDKSIPEHYTQDLRGTFDQVEKQLDDLLALEPVGLDGDAKADWLARKKTEFSKVLLNQVGSGVDVLNLRTQKSVLYWDEKLPMLQSVVVEAKKKDCLDDATAAQIAVAFQVMHKSIEKNERLFDSPEECHEFFVQYNLDATDDLARSLQKLTAAFELYRNVIEPLTQCRVRLEINQVFPGYNDLFKRVNDELKQEYSFVAGESAKQKQDKLEFLKTIKSSYYVSGFAVLEKKKFEEDAKETAELKDSAIFCARLKEIVDHEALNVFMANLPVELEPDGPMGEAVQAAYLKVLESKLAGIDTAAGFRVFCGEPFNEYLLPGGFDAKFGIPHELPHPKLSELIYAVNTRLFDVAAAKVKTFDQLTIPEYIYPSGEIVVDTEGKNRGSLVSLKEDKEADFKQYCEKVKKSIPRNIFKSILAAEIKKDAAKYSCKSVRKMPEDSKNDLISMLQEAVKKEFEARGFTWLDPYAKSISNQLEDRFSDED